MPVLVLTGTGTDSPWWKIGALLTHPGEHPDVRRAAFADDLLGDVDDLGITYAETLAEALDDLGVEQLLLSPGPATGLTVDELDQLRAWVTTAPAPTALPRYEAESVPPLTTRCRRLRIIRSTCLSLLRRCRWHLRWSRMTTHSGRNRRRMMRTVR